MVRPPPLVLRVLRVRAFPPPPARDASMPGRHPRWHRSPWALLLRVVSSCAGVVRQSLRRSVGAIVVCLRIGEPTGAPGVTSRAERSDVPLAESADEATASAATRDSSRGPITASVPSAQPAILGLAPSRSPRWPALLLSATRQDSRPMCPCPTRHSAVERIPFRNLPTLRARRDFRSTDTPKIPGWMFTKNHVRNGWRPGVDRTER
jgi:hypothetical protein